MMKKETLVTWIVLTLTAACYAKEISSTILLPQDAALRGEKIRINKRRECIADWRDPQDSIQFKIPELEEGKYTIFIKYATLGRGGGKILIELNDHEIKEKFKTTDSNDAIFEQKVGCFDHEGGSMNIKLSILDINHEGVPIMDVFSLTLEPK